MEKFKELKETQIMPIANVKLGKSIMWSKL